VIDLGKRLETIAFYDGDARKAEVKLRDLGGKFPFIIILPQSAFEDLLEQSLKRAGVKVEWNHRFDSLEEEEDRVIAMVEHLEGTGTGYIVPHWEMVVKNRRPAHAEFLIGADGPNSLVRARLGIEMERTVGPDFFAAYEFESEQPAGDEVRIVLDDKTANVLWPLTGNKYRWTFQLIKSEVSSEFPEKERRAARFAPKAVDESIRKYVEKIAHHRAPWFTAGVKEISWCTEVAFEQRRAKQFGRGRCWLAGDAGHQAGPVGAQSMNVGLGEAEALAGALQRILRAQAPLSSLEVYERERQAEWGGLLEVTKRLTNRKESSPWVQARRHRILGCLPASGEDLSSLAEQLKCDF
jgi:2-polyprenyl-6-methoxyphenol hydroxylase-like FAD-dependent oxidoreductase